MKKKSGDPIIHFRLPAGDIAEIDALIQKRLFKARSDFLRGAVLSEIKYWKDYEDSVKKGLLKEEPVPYEKQRIGKLLGKDPL